MEFFRHVIRNDRNRVSPGSTARNESLDTNCSNIRCTASSAS